MKHTFIINVFKEPASKQSPSTIRKHHSNNNRGGRNNRNQRRNDQKFNNPFVNPLDDSPAKETSQSQNSKVCLKKKVFYCV